MFTNMCMCIFVVLHFIQAYDTITCYMISNLHVKPTHCPRNGLKSPCTPDGRLYANVGICIYNVHIMK